MRGILFRGKTPSQDEHFDDGEWVQGFYACFNGEEHRIYSGYADTDCLDYYPEWYNVRPETVGQYTGLTDKNGKKIFEGDILLIKTTLDSVDKVTRDDEYTANGVVVFSEGHFELDGRGLVLCTYWGVKSLFVAAHFKEYEVIGNIHDNPELLKGYDN